MNTTELTTAVTTLSRRITQLERLLKGAASSKQLNELTLLQEKLIADLTVEVTSLKTRVSTLETTLSGIV